MKKTLGNGISFFLRGKDGIANSVVGDDDGDIDFVPFADIHAGNAIYSDFNDGIIALGRGIGEVGDRLGDDVGETGILEVLLDNTVIGGHANFNIRHLDFTFGKVGVADFFAFQTGKFSTMSNFGLTFRGIKRPNVSD